MKAITTDSKRLSDWQELHADALASRTRRHLDQPLYYSGKWWARRLAVVTRWLIKKALNGQPGVVLDPFAGSGTTVGEALRLKHRAIGVDIHPFAATLTREAFTARHKRLAVEFERIAVEAISELRHLYGSPKSPSAYFWSYEQKCPKCRRWTLLLKRYVLVQHAYPARFPAGVAICPRSRHVFPVKDVNLKKALCPCGVFVPLAPRRDGRFHCTHCGSNVNPTRNGRAGRISPRTVLLAVEMRKKTQRIYSSPTRTARQLARATATTRLAAAPIATGSSTEQLLAWGYKDWADLFHPRQHALAFELASRIKRVRDPVLRQQLALAFSPVFEYHCRLTSFKGLGTGSIRQAFSRPVLHPVSVSFESNPTVGDLSGNPLSWYSLRTRRSEQAFDQLLLLRGGKVRLGSIKSVLQGKAEVSVRCLDSSHLRLPANSIDAVITDPPYFDRIYYDDLGGAFRAWMGWCGVANKSGGNGAQSADLKIFSRRLANAFRAVCQGLKPRAPFLFTFHHQEADAWIALAEALSETPLLGHDLLLVPSEMPNTINKSRAHKPIAYDAVLWFKRQGRRRHGDAAMRAVDLAAKRLQECPSRMLGDSTNAAYAAALIEGMRQKSSPKDWGRLFDEVATKILKRKS